MQTQTNGAANSTNGATASNRLHAGAAKVSGRKGKKGKGKKAPAVQIDPCLAAAQFAASAGSIASTSLKTRDTATGLTGQYKLSLRTQAATSAALVKELSALPGSNIAGSYTYGASDLKNAPKHGEKGVTIAAVRAGVERFIAADIVD